MRCRHGLQQESGTIAGRGTDKRSGNLAGLGRGENTTAGGAAWAYGDAAESLCWPAGNEGGLCWMAGLGAPSPKAGCWQARKGGLSSSSDVSLRTHDRQLPGSLRRLQRFNRPQTYLFVLTHARLGQQRGEVCFNRPQTYLFVLTERSEPPKEEVALGFNRPQTYLFVLTYGDFSVDPLDLGFNRPQTYLFVLTGECTSVRGFTVSFQSSSDVSLRTHAVKGVEGRLPPDSFNRPQTYLFVLTERSAGRQRPSTTVSIVLRRISSYSPNISQAEDRVHRMFQSSSDVSLRTHRKVLYLFGY